MSGELLLTLVTEHLPFWRQRQAAACTVLRYMAPSLAEHAHWALCRSALRRWKRRCYRRARVNSWVRRRPRNMDEVPILVF